MRADLLGLLADMAQSSLSRLEAARSRESEAALRRRALDTPPAPALKLNGAFDIIAECKLRSPSLGDLSAHTSNANDRVASYARAGACAISVLTEPTRFGGELDHLEAAVKALGNTAPALRKDFLVDPYQLLEARAAGAGGALVIVRMLDRAGIDAMLDCARELGLFILLEAFDAEDLALARDVVAQRHGEHILVGLNCRDLATLNIDFARFAELRADMPARFPLVAESGILSPDDAARAAQLGYGVALIGSALMNTPDPASLLAAMLAAGRREKAPA